MSVGSCRVHGHHPAEPMLIDDEQPGYARAVVHCHRCKAYITSFEGPIAAVRRIAASALPHGLRYVPV